MILPIIVLGSGGHAKVILDTLLLLSVPVIGLTDAAPEKIGTTLLGVPVIGSDEVVMKYSTSEIELVNGLGSVSSTLQRRRLFEHFVERGYSFANVIHPSAVIAKNVRLGHGVQIMAGAVIQTSSIVGNNVILNTKTSVDHDNVIGSHVHVAPGATLSGLVIVEEGAHIGTGAIVIQGIKVGTESIVGAGAVVIRDIAARATVIGVPAREVKRQ